MKENTTQKQSLLSLSSFIYLLLLSIHSHQIQRSHMQSLLCAFGTVHSTYKETKKKQNSRKRALNERNKKTSIRIKINHHKDHKDIKIVTFDCIFGQSPSTYFSYNFTTFSHLLLIHFLFIYKISFFKYLFS